LKPSRSRKKAAPPDRRDELLKRRAASAKLCAVCPDVAQLRVALEFEAQAVLPHASQSYALFPAAKAYFVYPCPFGDCDGTYDLQSVVVGTLDRHGKSSAGSLKCSGKRIRDGVAGAACELEVSYSVEASYAVAEVAAPRRARSGT
jgi:hypothetical protein